MEKREINLIFLSYDESLIATQFLFSMAFCQNWGIYQNLMKINIDTPIYISKE